VRLYDFLERFNRFLMRFDGFWIRFSHFLMPLAGFTRRCWCYHQQLNKSQKSSPTLSPETKDFQV